MKHRINRIDYIRLHHAVISSLATSLAQPSQHEEPQLVANMVYHIPRAINGFQFSVSGSKTDIQSGGVYIHSQPFVHCTYFPEERPNSVEIGDLLLLRTEKQGEQVISRHAILLQAKKFKSLPACPDNKNQHHLYAKWPPFKYVRSTSELNGRKRHLKGADLYNGSKYLLINEKAFCGFDLCLHRCGCPPYCFMLTAHPTWPELSHHQCFVSELCDFILGDAGKSYKYPPHWNDRNWNRVIYDLCSETAKIASVYISRTSGTATDTRGQCLCFISGNFSDKDSNFHGLTGLSNIGMLFADVPPEVPDGKNDGDGARGISVIEFIINSGQG